MAHSRFFTGLAKGLWPGRAWAMACACFLNFGLDNQPAQSQEQVELELLLAVDCSSSVSEQEYLLQMQGLGRAFRDPAVLSALRTAGTRGIAVSVMQWAGIGSHVLAVGWTRISDPLEALDFSYRVERTSRLVEGGPTGLGDAMSAARESILTNDFSAKRMVIDVSGDGQANEGIHAATARAAAMKAGITVNGLAILNEEKDLDRYYLAGVVGGPDSFLVTAYDYEDFAHAIRRKLINEISGSPLSRHQNPEEERNLLSFSSVVAE